MKKSKLYELKIIHVRKKRKHVARVSEVKGDKKKKILKEVFNEDA